LVLGRGRDFVLDRERGQELGDLGSAHLHGVALTVEKDVTLDPVDVRLLGGTAIVANADILSDAVEKARLRWTYRAGLAGGNRGRSRYHIRRRFTRLECTHPSAPLRLKGS